MQTKPNFPFDNTDLQELNQIDQECARRNKIVYRCLAAGAIIACLAIVLTLSGCDTEQESKKRKPAFTEEQLDKTIEEINRNTEVLQVEKTGPKSIVIVPKPQYRSSASPELQNYVIPSAPSTRRSGPSIADGRNDCTDLGNGQIHCPPTR